MEDGQTVLTHAMASSFPCHKMCRGPDKSPMVHFTCLSGLPRRLRLKMTDRHVSLFPAK